MKVKKSNIIRNFSRRRFLGAAGAVSAFSFVPRHVLGKPSGKEDVEDRRWRAQVPWENRQ